MNESRQPSVCTIVVNWNGREYTGDCLASLRKIGYPNMHTILVDNGSSDGSVNYVQKHYPEVEIIALDSNTGFTGGNNAGMQSALKQNYDYVLLLNNDTTVHEPDFLSKIVTACEKNDKIGMACPTIFYDRPPGKVWYAGGWLSLWRGWGHYHQVPQDDSVTTAGYATGCCLLAKTEMIADIGLLNDAYFLSVEDVEWSARAQKNGWETVYVPGASIIHKDSISSRGSREGKFSPMRVFHEFRNSIWFVREYSNPLQKFGLWPVRFLFYYLYKSFAYIFLARWEKLNALTRGLQDGIFTGSSTFKNDD